MKKIRNISLVITVFLAAFFISFLLSLYLNINDNQMSTAPTLNENFQKTFYGSNENKPEKMIIADLLNMRISLVSSSSIETLPIITKGKPGSYYETPVGEYEAGLKNPKHWSTLGEVYMPYSVQFYANFFIHGIPYHTDGTKVSSTYSGGCIRLADEDAKKVYDFATPKMKILVIGRDENINEDNFILDSVSAYNLLFTVVTLESTNQEKVISYHGDKIKIKDLTEEIVNGDSEAVKIIYSQLGKDNINKLIQKKSDAIGISSTTFESDIDKKILINYIYNYKKFLLSYL